MSPDGAVRLETTDCRGESAGTPRVVVDGNPLPRASAADAADHRRRPPGDGRPGTSRLMDILTGRPGWPSVLLARAATVAG